MFGLQSSTIRSQTFAFCFNDSMGIFVSRKWTRPLALRKKEAITISGDIDDSSEFLIIQIEVVKSIIIYRNDNSSCMIARAIRFGDDFFFCPNKIGLHLDIKCCALAQHGSEPAGLINSNVADEYAKSIRDFDSIQIKEVVIFYCNH